MSGLKFKITYDQSVSTLPSGFTTAVTAACSYLSSQFTNTLTISLHVGRGEVHGIALGSAVAASYTTLNGYSYGQVRGALISHATSADAKSAVGALPQSDPTHGGHYWVTPPEAVVLGLLPQTTTLNCYIGFSKTAKFDFSASNGITAGRYDFNGAAVHEITETMGRLLEVGGNIGGFRSYLPLDLFHFSAAGVHSFVGTKAGYFSINNGQTHLANFNTSAGGDFGDWASAFNHGRDAFLAFGTTGVVNPVSEVDLKVMNVLGYQRASPPAAPADALVASLSDGDHAATGAVHTLSGDAGADHLVFNWDVPAAQAERWHAPAIESDGSLDGHREGQATAADNVDAHAPAEHHLAFAHLSLPHGDFIL